MSRHVNPTISCLSLFFLREGLGDLEERYLTSMIQKSVIDITKKKAAVGHHINHFSFYVLVL